ncbi:MAG: hypothetical protein ACFFE2_03370 [Candidatus Thorarchaeota archaeon]
MINEFVQISRRIANERKQDPVLRARMELATQGQSPRYLLISPINRSGQDLQLFNMSIGDAFHATRVPGHALLSPDLSPTLLKWPAAYNHEFPNKKGVIVTFDFDEPLEVIRKTIESISLYPDLQSMPIIAFQVNYNTADLKIIVHGKGRDYESEIQFLRRVRLPDEVDTSVLVFICSDSRVRPPYTNKGIPMSIQTLGGYIPPLTRMEDETRQLNRFFQNWLQSKDNAKRILIVAHGNFEGNGASCGVGTASLNPAAISSKFLRQAIEEIRQAAQEFETNNPTTPEDRVKSMSKAVRKNLLTYPAIAEAHDLFGLEIDEILMDTVTNTLFQSDELKFPEQDAIRSSY